MKAGSTEHFSWSLRRQKMFEFCKKAYIYHYHCASGGWDEYADDRKRKIYQLKQIRKTEEWCVELLSDAIAELFPATRPLSHPLYNAFGEMLKHKLMRESGRRMGEVCGELWREDPKALNLFEVYYGKTEKIQDRVASYVRQRLAQHLHNFRNTTLFRKLCDVEPLRFKTIARPQNFMIGELEVWCSPSLIWEEGGQLRILNIRSGGIIDSEALKISSGLNALMGEQLFHVPLENILTQFYFTGELNQPPSVISQPSSFEPKELILYIKNCANIILAQLSPYPELKINDFSGWQIPQICSGCKFKELCTENNDQSVSVEKKDIIK